MSLHILFQPIRPRPWWRRPLHRGSTPSEFELTRAQTAAVVAVLRRYHLRVTDPFDPAIIDLEPGSRIEVTIDSIGQGCIITVELLTPMLLRLMLDLLRAADWVMMLPPPCAAAIAARPLRLRSTSRRFPGVRPVVCHSAAKLAAVLWEAIAPAGQSLNESFKSFRQPRPFAGFDPREELGK